MEIKLVGADRCFVLIPYAARWLLIEEHRHGLVVEHVFLPNAPKRVQPTSRGVRLFYKDIGSFLADCLIEDLDELLRDEML